MIDYFNIEKYMSLEQKDHFKLYEIHFPFLFHAVVMRVKWDNTCKGSELW
jgi:hypothetical protein